MEAKKTQEREATLVRVVMSGDREIARIYRDSAGDVFSVYEPEE